MIQIIQSGGSYAQEQSFIPFYEQRLETFACPQEKAFPLIVYWWCDVGSATVGDMSRMSD